MCSLTSRRRDEGATTRLLAERKKPPIHSGIRQSQSQLPAKSIEALRKPRVGKKAINRVAVANLLECLDDDLIIAVGECDIGHALGLRSEHVSGCLK